MITNFDAAYDRHRREQQQRDVDAELARRVSDSPQQRVARPSWWRSLLGARPRPSDRAGLRAARSDGTDAVHARA